MFGDTENPIGVGVESRELICVGNPSKSRLKIQFSATENIIKYTIRTKPKVISLQKGKAVEFEIFVKPKCSCKIDDKIIIFSKNLEDGITQDNQIILRIYTEITTRLDPDELVEDKKFGEYSFGIVYKETFRGNCVAIKKMKEFNENDLDEFENEIKMLDKFRSEYTVHFYGAVFIPNKVCMVTEFAQFGSLQNLMKNRTSNNVDMKLRTKFVLDASKGILYFMRMGYYTEISNQTIFWYFHLI
ncbi:protein serine/threonine kinase, putative [Entamoeba invadens IP1]|uniref:Protein serine/threonine kinase, putative n=1 Tax=Entamoeba invadens IP1 TaxID=370355 RepID=A0A0A1TXE3_ENTIV|nr:protein serine/threonine kinase, putative [Entamoeba invadens IP1]ELP84175.1 protein serine/threonine kinase, putative [Entamoeba invadens IP1]|eukprot:XP_004183521.1 protein serine/threonine kinase, putative [Entamoeba invadens IP1]